MELFDAGGRFVFPPSAGVGDSQMIAEFASGQESGQMIAEATSEQAYGEEPPLVSDSCYVSFAGSDERYMLLVYGSARAVDELRHAFLRVLPLLLVLSALPALLFALFYAAVIMQLQNMNKRLAEDIERERALERARWKSRTRWSILCRSC